MDALLLEAQRYPFAVAVAVGLLVAVAYDIWLAFAKPAIDKGERHHTRKDGQHGENRRGDGYGEY